MSSDEPFTLRQKVRLAVASIAVILVIILVLQNQEMVSTRLFMWSLDMPRFVLLGSVFLVGGLAGYLVAQRR